MSIQRWLGPFLFLFFIAGGNASVTLHRSGNSPKGGWRGAEGGRRAVPRTWVLVQQTDRPGNGAHQMRQRHPEPDDG